MDDTSKRDECFKEFEAKFGEENITQLNEKYGFDSDHNFLYRYCQMMINKFDNANELDAFLHFCRNDQKKSVEDLLNTRVRLTSLMKKFNIAKAEKQYLNIQEYEGDEENVDENKDEEDNLLREVRDIKDFLQDISDTGLDQKTYESSLKLNGEILKVNKELSDIKSKMNEKREKKATYQQSLEIYERLNDVNESVNETLGKSKDIEKKLPDSVDTFSKSDCYKTGFAGFIFGVALVIVLFFAMKKFFY